MPPQSISHGSFLLLVTSLTRPVSFYGAIPGFFNLSIDSVGKKYLQILQTQTGAGAETHHPSQSEGSIFRWLGGILKGKTPNGSELFSP